VASPRRLFFPFSGFPSFWFPIDFRRPPYNFCLRCEFRPETSTSTILSLDIQGRLATDGRGLPQVFLGSAMPYPSTLCRRVTTKMASWLVQGRSVTLWPSSTPLDTPRRTPMVWSKSRAKNHKHFSFFLPILMMKRPKMKRPKMMTPLH
jgi:hypothetical protein